MWTKADAKPTIVNKRVVHARTHPYQGGDTLGSMENNGSTTTIDIRLNELTSRAMDFNERNIAPALQKTINLLADEATASNSGGKRLRAQMLLDTYHAAAAKNSAQKEQAALDLACAVEMYQTSALIHDDIIDESALRRGRPSTYTALAQTAGSTAQGKGLALMLGNMLATASAQAASTALHTIGLAEQLDVFLNMQHAVETGQCLDQAAGKLSLKQPRQLEQAALNVYAWKTASYTTVAPLELGVLCAGMPATAAHKVALAVGLPLGVAFQINDDLLDVLSDSSITGKPVGGDIVERKRTVLLADMLQAANTEQRTIITDFYESQPDSGNTTIVLDLLVSTGAVAHSKQRIKHLLEQSKTALAHFGLPAHVSTGLTAVCDSFISRAGILV